MNDSEYVVVGAGLAGAATAWSLARRGHEVTVLERTHPAAQDGSSHGSARIFRYAYPDPFYSALVVEATVCWADLVRDSGQQLITPTGALDFGRSRDPRALARVLEGIGVEHELLDARHARERWPQIAFDTEVLWHHAGGVIDSEGAVLAMIGQARAHGATVMTGWDVASITAAPSGYRITSATGDTVGAAKVVIAAGGFLPGLLADVALPSAFRALVPPLQVRQEQAYHFPYREQSQALWPTVIHKSEQISTYSLPGGRDADFRGQKVAEYNVGKIIGSARDQDGVVDPANRSRMIDYVRRYLPGLVPQPYAEATCLFTNTPTEDFIIDGVAGITLLSPCSGHGAKFAPLLGELAADAASGARSVPDVFRLAGASSALSGASRAAHQL